MLLNGVERRVSDSRCGPVFQEAAPLNGRVLALAQVDRNAAALSRIPQMFTSLTKLHCVGDGSITEGGNADRRTVHFSGRIIRRNGSNLLFR